MERQPQRRHGRVRRLDPEQVKWLLDARPDLTLHGLQEALSKEGTSVSPSHLWRVLLRGLGYRLKKSRSTPPNATATRTVKGVRSSWDGSPKSRPNG